MRCEQRCWRYVAQRDVTGVAVDIGANYDVCHVGWVRRRRRGGDMSTNIGCRDIRPNGNGATSATADYERLLPEINSMRVASMRRWTNAMATTDAMANGDDAYNLCAVTRGVYMRRTVAAITISRTSGGATGVSTTQRRRCTMRVRLCGNDGVQVANGYAISAMPNDMRVCAQQRGPGARRNHEIIDVVRWCYDDDVVTQHGRRYGSGCRCLRRCEQRSG